MIYLNSRLIEFVRTAYGLVPDRLLGWMYGRDVYNGTITK